MNSATLLVAEIPETALHLDLEDLSLSAASLRHSLCVLRYYSFPTTSQALCHLSLISRNLCEVRLWNLNDSEFLKGFLSALKFEKSISGSFSNRKTKTKQLFVPYRFCIVLTYSCICKVISHCIVLYFPPEQKL